MSAGGGFDYEGKAQNIVNILNAYNTTTSLPYLSYGMNTLVANVYLSDPDVVSIRASSYPCVFVRVNSKTENFSSIGMTGYPSGTRKFAEVQYDIIGLHQKEGAYNPYSDVLINIYRLGQNIEAIFQKEVTLSNTALWCQPVRTEYLGPFSGDGVWVKGVMVQLNAKYLFVGGSN